MRVPAEFFVWALWRRRGGVPADRPTGLRRVIPPTWFAEYRRRGYRPVVRASKPAPPPAPIPLPPSVFAGVGLFTAWDPGVVLRHRPRRVQWVAVRPEWPHPDDPTVTLGCSPATAEAIRRAGYRLHVWEDPDFDCQGQAAVERLGAAGWIGQAENPVEVARAVDAGPSLHVPKALVANATPLTAWPAGWELIFECYWNAGNPAPDGMDSRGVPVASMCFGVYDATGNGGRRVPLADYLARWQGSWSGYLAEGMTDADWQLVT